MLREHFHWQQYFPWFGGAFCKIQCERSQKPEVKDLTLNSMDSRPRLRLRRRVSRKSTAGRMSRDTSVILFSSRAAASEEMTSRTKSTHHMVQGSHMTTAAGTMTHGASAPHSTVLSLLSTGKTGFRVWPTFYFFDCIAKTLLLLRRTRLIWSFSRWTVLLQSCIAFDSDSVYTGKVYDSSVASSSCHCHTQWFARMNLSSM